MHILGIIGSVILSVFGLILLIVAGHRAYTQYFMRKHGKKYNGAVVDEVQDWFDDGYEYRRVYDPVIQYQNDRNEIKRLKSSIGTGTRWKIGEAIDVYEFKYQVFIDHRIENCILDWGLSFFGVLLIICGIYFVFH